MIKELMSWRAIGLASILFGFNQSPRLNAAEVNLTVRPPGALQQEWDERMLAGTFGSSYNGDARNAETACKFAIEWVYQVASTGCGIRVVDLRERRWLKSRGGWVLEGGLLGRVQVANVQIELYGKTIHRDEPYAEPLPHVWIGNYSWNLAHEFFLLRRDKPGLRASILQNWNVPDPQRRGGYPLLPRGSLMYNSASAIAVVRIVNAHREELLSDRVNIANVVVK